MRALMLDGPHAGQLGEVDDPPPAHLRLHEPEAAYVVYRALSRMHPDLRAPTTRTVLYELVDVGAGGAVYVTDPANADRALDFAHDPDLWES